jgi:uncharacterized protein (DUF885 family)
MLLLLLFGIKGNAQQNNPKLHQLFDEYYKEINSLSPLNATFKGVNDYNDQLPADDEAQLKKSHDFYANYLHQLQGFAKVPLNKEDKISYEILENDLKTALLTLRKCCKMKQHKK